MEILALFWFRYQSSKLNCVCIIQVRYSYNVNIYGNNISAIKKRKASIPSRQPTDGLFSLWFYTSRKCFHQSKNYIINSFTTSALVLVQYMKILCEFPYGLFSFYIIALWLHDCCISLHCDCMIVAYRELFCSCDTSIYISVTTVIDNVSHELMLWFYIWSASVVSLKWPHDWWKWKGLVCHL